MLDMTHIKPVIQERLAELGESAMAVSLRARGHKQWLYDVLSQERIRPTTLHEVAKALKIKPSLFLERVNTRQRGIAQ